MVFETLAQALAPQGPMVFETLAQALAPQGPLTDPVYLPKGFIVISLS